MSKNDKAAKQSLPAEMRNKPIIPKEIKSLLECIQHKLNITTENIPVYIFGNGGQCCIKQSDTYIVDNYKENPHLMQFIHGQIMESAFDFVKDFSHNESTSPHHIMINTIADIKESGYGPIDIKLHDNSFLDHFTVDKTKHNFSKRQIIAYVDTYPRKILVIDNNNIISLINQGAIWYEKSQYEYQKLNYLSRIIYDKLIANTTHDKLYSYLHDVERLAQGEKEVIADKSKEYQEKATALAKEHYDVKCKSLSTKYWTYFKDGIDPTTAKASNATISPEKFVPAYIIFAQNTKREDYERILSNLPTIFKD